MWVEPEHPAGEFIRGSTRPLCYIDELFPPSSFVLRHCFVILVSGFVIPPCPRFADRAASRLISHTLPVGVISMKSSAINWSTMARSSFSENRFPK